MSGDNPAITSERETMKSTDQSPFKVSGLVGIAHAIARLSARTPVRTAWFALLAALVLLLPLAVGVDYEISRYRLALVYLLLAMGLNLAYGFAGELILSHAVVAAASAYGGGILAAEFGFPFIPAALLSIVAAVIVSALLASPGIRVRGDYLLLITFFAVTVVEPLVVLGEGLTGGEYGLIGIPGPSVLGSQLSPVAFYELIAVLTLVIFVMIRNLINSSWGIRFRLVRDAPHAAEAVGVNLPGTRVIAHVLFAIPAGVAGVSQSFGDQYVNATQFGTNLTLIVLTAVILGGKGTLWGPVVGTLPVVALTFWVGPFSSYNPIVFGVVLVIVVLLFPNGVIPAVKEKFAPARQERRGDTTPSEARGAEAGGLAPDDSNATVSASKAVLPTGSEKLLEVRGLEKAFGGVVAVRGASFAVDEGSITGLVGENGSGKSTVLNLVNGFYRADAGTVTLRGQKIEGRSVAAIARQGFGRTFQIPRLVGHLSVGQNIEAGLLASDRSRLFGSLVRTPGVQRDERRRWGRVLEVVQLLGLPEGFEDVPIEALPLGLKRIIEVGRAVAARPAILLLDEPAAGLNDEERVRLGEVLRVLQSEGMTILVVEHNVEFLMRFCDALHLLKLGEVVSSARLDSNIPLPHEVEEYLRYSPLESGRREVVTVLDGTSTMENGNLA
jgi:branched-chain amino acid transport system permease protein